MGTRSLVKIVDDNETILTLYRQYDGYLSGMGLDIKNALNNGKSKLTNGYSLSDSVPSVFNGLGCLAAYLVGALKRRTNDDNSLKDVPAYNSDWSIGNVYIMSPNTNDVGEEFIYTLSEKNGKINIKVFDVYADKVLYNGVLNRFNPEKLEKKLDE